jgi:hypothetical protein
VDDKCVRWRAIAIEQFGYSLNLTLTFTVAALAFSLALLRDDNFHPTQAAKKTLVIALITLFASAVVGYWCTLNRLLDIRGTARRACKHPEAPAQDKLRDLGKRSLALFRIQVFLFAGGAVALALTLGLSYWQKMA